MKSRLMAGTAGVLLLLAVIWATVPARAVTDGSLRQNLEDNHFGEFLIRSSLYAKTSHDVYHPEKRRFVHGLERVNQPFIYEPDTYTWELAMAAHRKRVFDMPQTMDPIPGAVMPQPMSPDAMPPLPPGQVQLTPLGDQALISQPLPLGSDEKMQQMLFRARAAGLNPQSPLQAGDIKQRLMNHMNTLSVVGAGPGPSQMAPGGMVPLSPVPPQGMPGGRAADSYDGKY